MNSRKASIISGLYIRASSSPRACPSPCSPESEPPIADHQIRGVAEELAPFLDAAGGSQIERQTRMHASLPEVAVQRPDVLVLVDQRLEFPQIRAEAVGRNRCVLPAFVVLGHAGYLRRRAQPFLAQVPDELLLGGIVEQLHRGWIAALLDALHALPRVRVGLRLVLVRRTRSAAMRCQSGMKFMSGGWSPFFFM